MDEDLEKIKNKTIYIIKLVFGATLVWSLIVFFYRGIPLDYWRFVKRLFVVNLFVWPTLEILRYAIKNYSHDEFLKIFFKTTQAIVALIYLYIIFIVIY